MMPQRWSRIKEVFGAALEKPEPERPGFLDSACNGDAALRAEVERLLAESDAVSLHSPVSGFLNVAAELAPGDPVANYRIEARLGEGGMGVVYKATDTRLGRSVALKFVKAQFSRHWEREARAVAALNHPHIATLYEVGDHEGSPYLAMELVDGRPLKGPLPVKQVIEYGIQIADALAAAHAAGIVHRDLKPANVLVTEKGFVKVLDFGLAKLAEQEGAPASTQTASLAGTPGYMAPEQIEGTPPDTRSDIFAFGCIFYELLSGRRAFAGETITAALTAAATTEPKPLHGVPERLDELIRLCLRKGPESRLQHIDDARILLEVLREDFRSGGAGSPQARAAREAPQESASDFATAAHLIKRHKKAAIGSAAVMAALVALPWFLPQRPPKPSSELTQKRLTFNSSESPVESDAISPDGKYLAYSDPAGIHMKLLSTSEERLIPRPVGVPAGAYWHIDSWFPDGTQLLADANQPGGHKSMWTVSVLGQSPRQLREGASGFGVSPEGTHIVFGRIGTSGYVREIWVMGTQGDEPRKVLAVGENEPLGSVQWSPNGQRLAYIKTQRTADNYRFSIETCDLKGTSRTVVVSVDAGCDCESELNDFCWLPDGRIVYSRRESRDSHRDVTESNLWQIVIDNNTGASIGKPKRITQWAGNSLWGLSASADGKRLVLRKETLQQQVYLGELAAGGTRMKPPRRLTNDEAIDYPTAWTADSKAVLFVSNRNGTWGIFKQAIGEETSEPVVTGPQDASYPRLSADGAWILYVESLRTRPNPAPPDLLMRIPVSGGVPQVVLETRNWEDFWCTRSPASLCVIGEKSQDQKQFVITAFDPLKGRGKVLRTIENDPLHDYSSTAPSPDGSTYAISRSREAEIHIRLLSLSGGSDREITVKGWPNITGLDWSPDGKGFYCGSVSPQGYTLLYADLKGSARVLWQQNARGGGIWGAPSPDGRYLAIGDPVTDSNIWLVEGF